MPLKLERIDSVRNCDLAQQDFADHMRDLDAIGKESRRFCRRAMIWRPLYRPATNSAASIERAPSQYRPANRTSAAPARRPTATETRPCAVISPATCATSRTDTRQTTNDHSARIARARESRTPRQRQSRVSSLARPGAAFDEPTEAPSWRGEEHIARQQLMPPAYRRACSFEQHRYRQVARDENAASSQRQGKVG